MPIAAIERPNCHQALGGLAGAAYLAVFADMAELDHHRLFKGFVVHHGRNVERPNWLQLWRGSCAQTSQDPADFRSVLTQFRTAGYGEVAEPNHVTPFLELL
jgi:hypothetical protein